MILRKLFRETFSMHSVTEDVSLAQLITLPKLCRIYVNTCTNSALGSPLFVKQASILDTEFSSKELTSGNSSLPGKISLNLQVEHVQINYPAR